MSSAVYKFASAAIMAFVFLELNPSLLLPNIFLHYALHHKGCKRQCQAGKILFPVLLMPQLLMKQL